MKIHVQVFRWTHFVAFLRIMVELELLGYMVTLFNFLRKCQTISHSSCCIIWHSHYQWMKVSISVHHLQTFYFPFIIIIIVNLVIVNGQRRSTCSNDSPEKILILWFRFAFPSWLMMLKDLCTENCKTLIKEINEDTNRKTSHVHGLEDVILLKCSTPPKVFHRLKANPDKFQWYFFLQK
jgi:hypothetical protein